MFLKESPDRKKAKKKKQEGEEEEIERQLKIFCVTHKLKEKLCYKFVRSNIVYKYNWYTNISLYMAISKLF